MKLNSGPNTSSSESISRDEEKRITPCAIKVTIRGRCRVGVKMSNKRQILFTSGKHYHLPSTIPDRGFSASFSYSHADLVTYKKLNDLLRLESPSFKIAVDSRNIFSIEGFHLMRLANSDALKTERMNAEGFVLPTNKIL